MTLMIFLTIIPMLSGTLYLAYAQTVDFNNGTNTVADNPGAIYVTFLTTAASMIIAIIGMATAVMKSKALQGKISETTFEQLDAVKQIATKFVQQSETSKQFADTIFFQLLPEQAKQIAGAYAIKTKNLNAALEKDVNAVNELTELVKKYQEGTVKDPVIVANLMKSIVARSEQKPIIPLDKPYLARKTITKDGYEGIEQ